MRRGILHGISLVGVQLALGSVVFYSVIDAQTVETSTPKQDQASVSSESSPIVQEVFPCSSRCEAYGARDYPQGR
jgi:hypothetical protein